MRLLVVGLLVHAAVYAAEPVMFKRRLQQLVAYQQWSKEASEEARLLGNTVNKHEDSDQNRICIQLSNRQKKIWCAAEHHRSICQ
jgi:hypothetical protein